MGSAQQTHWPSLHHIHIFSLKKREALPLLIRNRQAVPALFSSTGKDLSPILSAHALSKAMISFSL
jgi:hypothetical protein